MRIVTYKIDIASFDDEAIPDEDSIKTATEEAIRTECGPDVTVRATFLCEGRLVEPNIGLVAGERGNEKEKETVKKA